jgi:hypothetical protein
MMMCGGGWVVQAPSTGKKRKPLIEEVADAAEEPAPAPVSAKKKAKST